ncbi:hypothetical protein [Rhodopirellula sp. P2]|uniref:hypothetical protein n=1 Tax=Rhodopirellula sp. P2 TaxID=2127060 RepID=UPI0023687E77|nr:hypothetical protein [Rhodopirellula sp. P2]WDQ16287.1 hypothetical protein PSR62_22060 [Rhodopirellula sp. P2]
MNLTETSTNEYLSYEHPFNTGLLLLLGVVCLGTLLWTLYRERNILGRTTTGLFSMLRIVALSVAFWMLLAPTNVVEQSTTTRQAIVFVTDSSASMKTIDPPGTADDWRWTPPTSNEDAQWTGTESLRITDRSLAALGVANQKLHLAVSALDEHGAETSVAEHLELANQAIVRVRTHLQNLRDTLPDSMDSEIDSSLRRLIPMIDSPEMDALSDLTKMLQRGRTPSQTGWRESLPDLIERLATARRVFGELADQLERAIANRSPSKPTRAAGFTDQSRGDRVAKFLTGLQQSKLDEISEVADLRWCSFDDAAKAMSNVSDTQELLASLADQNAMATTTDVGAALQFIDQLRRDQPIAAAFLLSDVAHNHAHEREPTEVAAQLDSTPVYVIPIGNDLRLRDIDLISVSAPAVAMRNDDVVIEAHLGIYQCKGERCSVQLLQSGEVVDFRNVLIDSDAETRSVQFQQRVAQIGPTSFQIAIQPLDGEMTTENNFDEIEINVTRSDIKVLLADEMPRWEYRYLAQLFRRDPKIELDELLFRPRLIATGHRQETGGFPVTVEEWNRYDVVILGDLPIEHLPVASQTALLKYMRTRGGTVITIAGDHAMPQAYVDHPLEEAIPVRPIQQSDDANQQYSFQITEAGRSHAALMIAETELATNNAWSFVNQFSPLHSVSKWRAPVPTAQSLIAVVPRGEPLLADDPRLTESSFLCWQPVGRGRIIHLSGPDTYRLRFLRGDTLHYRFWGQLMRWAIAADLSSGNQSVRIRTAKTLYETNQPVDMDVELLAPDGQAVIRDTIDTDMLRIRLSVGEDVRTIPLVVDEERPGHYRADVRDLKPGVYQAKPEGTLIEELIATNPDAQTSTMQEVLTTFTVQADLPTELVDTRSNRALANQISTLTGGQVLPPTAVEEVLELTDLHPIVTHSIQRQPLWQRWRYLWLVLGCLQIEWIIRKSRGLS